MIVFLAKIRKIIPLMMKIILLLTAGVAGEQATREERSMK